MSKVRVVSSTPPNDDGVTTHIVAGIKKDGGLTKPQYRITLTPHPPGKWVTAVVEEKTIKGGELAYHKVEEDELERKFSTDAPAGRQRLRALEEVVGIFGHDIEHRWRKDDDKKYKCICGQDTAVVAKRALVGRHEHDSEQWELLVCDECERKFYVKMKKEGTPNVDGVVAVVTWPKKQEGATYQSTAEGWEKIEDWPEDEDNPSGKKPIPGLVDILMAEVAIKYMDPSS